MKINKKNILLSLAYFPYVGGIVTLFISIKHKYLLGTALQSIFISAFFVVLRVIAIFFKQSTSFVGFSDGLNLFTEISAPIIIIFFMIAALLGKEIHLPIFKKFFKVAQ